MVPIIAALIIIIIPTNLHCVLLLCSLFETFDVVSSDVEAAERLQLLQMTAKCSTKEELGI